MWQANNNREREKINIAAYIFYKCFVTVLLLTSIPLLYALVWEREEEVKEEMYNGPV